MSTPVPTSYLLHARQEILLALDTGQDIIVEHGAIRVRPLMRECPEWVSSDGYPMHVGERRPCPGADWVLLQGISERSLVQVSPRLTPTASVWLRVQRKLERGLAVLLQWWSLSVVREIR